MPLSATSAPRPPKAIDNLTHPRNPHFAGRHRILEALHKSLSTGSGDRTQIVHGMGGIGKTQVAIEYAYRYRNSYGLIWWMPADEPNTLASHFAKLADRLGVGEADRLSAEAARTAVVRALEQRNDWLLIFDNAPGAQVILPYLPPSGGRVLVTSRNPNWTNSAGTFCLRVFERSESIDFLVRRADRPAEPATALLAQALGDLPLALEQAAAMIRGAGLSFGEYLTRFEEHWAELLQSGRTSGDYPDSVAMTWELACRQVEGANVEVSALLKILAYLAPSEVSRSFLRRAAGNLPVPLSTQFGSLSGIEAAVTVLQRFSLLAADERAIFVHHIVGSLTRDRLPAEQQQNWCEVAVAMMERTFQFDPHSTNLWSDCSEALPHALAAASHAEAAGVAPAVTARLLNGVGEFLHQFGRFAESRSVLERALALSDIAHGSTDPRRAAVANNLGRVLKRLGDFEQARSHFESAMVLDQEAYGQSHPHVAESVNNYGTVLHHMGDVTTALQQFQWALEICQSTYGPHHPKVATVTNNLGYALAGTGELDLALFYFAQSLAIAEGECGAHHPLAASIRTNMGVVLQLKGQPAEARAQFERAWAIAEKSLGGSHADVARCVAHLGELHLRQGELVEARRCFERALAIDQDALGRAHLNLVSRLNGLGRCLKAMGDVDGAAACYERAAEVIRNNRNERIAHEPAPIFISG